MFQRGQKIIILESSAKARSHPNTGDVGYLNNIYLFLAHRFILIDIFLFSYMSSKRGSMEKKKLIIDLGMKSSLRHKISHQGVPSSFFIDDMNVINLSSTGYHIDGGLDNYHLENSASVSFVDFPQLYSSYGIWPNRRKAEVTQATNNFNFPSINEINKLPIRGKLIKVPFGQIALFSSKSSSKYSLETASVCELQAWMRTAIPTIASLIGLFCNYGNHYPVTNSVNSCFNRAKGIQLNAIEPFLSLNISPYTGSVVYRFREKLFMSTSSDFYSSRAHVMIKNINYLKSIANVLLHRLDSFNINRLVKLDSEMSYIRDLWNTPGGLLLVLDREHEVGSSLGPIYYLIRTIILRTLFLTENPYEKLRPLAKYFPAHWCVNLGERFESLESIRKRVDSDSSALARIYDVIE